MLSYNAILTKQTKVRDLNREEYLLPLEEQREQPIKGIDVQMGAIEEISNVWK